MEGIFKNCHYCIFGFIMGDFMLKIWFIIEDFIQQRNEDITLCLSKQWQLLQPNKLYATLLIILTIFSATKFIYDDIKISNEGFFISLNIAVCYFIQAKWKILESKSDLIHFIRNGNGLDYGSGMAHSYFYGYLNKILPHYGDENVGIKENIEKYEAKQGVQLPAKKLFILIPLSMYFSPSLIEPPDIMEACNSLETIHRDVAGVIGRSYSNSVYKIYINEMEGDRQKKPLYVVAEGATPLHTLYQTCTGRVPACSERIRDNSEEIVQQFYRTLARILESFPEYRDTYELVLYQGNENVAELLVSRIRSCS